jgi:hypothetical protein
MDSSPRVELLWWEGCPSTEAALADLRAALAEAGLDPERVEQREVDGEEAARAEGFVGSPTVRVAGVDVFPPGPDEPVGLTCRIYHRRDGRISPVPDPEDLRAALAAALTQERTST